jgi:hypothetical protein|tara:strand:- start:538 stop:672 length:135 start_codon:yes stop_codon:yes gene_type:complete
MPIPKPSGETKSQFMNKCMNSKVMKSEYSAPQRIAICYEQWSKK